jgi:hypothetical protein
MSSERIRPAAQDGVGGGHAGLDRQMQPLEFHDVDEAGRVATTNAPGR